jgi:hypothetical protein
MANILIAVFTNRAAAASRAAADAAAATSTGQLVVQLLTEYGTDEMREAVKGLSTWVRLSNTHRTETPDALDKEPIDRWRRRFSHYCQKVHSLRDLHLVDDEVVRRLAPRGVAEVFLGIEPLEAHPGYDQSSFKFFADFYGLPRRATLLRDTSGR